METKNNETIEEQNANSSNQPQEVQEPQEKTWTESWSDRFSNVSHEKRTIEMPNALRERIARMRGEEMSETQSMPTEYISVVQVFTKSKDESDAVNEAVLEFLKGKGVDEHNIVTRVQPVRR